MTLTNRLTCYFVGSLAIILVGFSLCLFFIATNYLRRQIDERLAAASRTLVAAAEIGPDGVEWEPAARDLRFDQADAGGELVWHVADNLGRTQDRSPVAAVDALPAIVAAVDAGRRTPRTVPIANGEWRAIRVRVIPPLDGPFAPDKHAELVITVATPLDGVHRLTRTLGFALAGLSVVVLGVAGLAGRAICRRALAPVTRMALAARDMPATAAAERLPVPPTRDELADLGRAVNDLLDRLQESFERQRQFTGEASHQLRTPLAAMLGQVEVALRRDRPAAEYRQALTAVADQIDRQRRVLDALLFLARADADAAPPDRERIDLAEWVPAHLRAYADHPRTTDLTWIGESTIVVVSPLLLGELIDNLIDNALKYSDPGTPIVVRIEPNGLHVEDQGYGIAAEDLGQLFRPFFRSAEARRRGVPGVGLGLAIASRLAVAIGGTLTCESHPGKGSRFQLSNIPNCN